MEVTDTEKGQLAHYEIPLSEGKAKEWIKSLSTTDIGGTTRRVFYGLVDFNRRMVPPVTRIRIAEMLRPKIDLLISNLQRHLSYQTFPLPVRAQKISDLNQSLLLEFAGTYQLAALDILTKESERKRALQIAIYRVIDYLGKYLLSTYAVYIRTRDTVWHDIHHMYLLASERDMDVQTFNDGSNKSCSIASRYIQVNLLALCKPYSMRQEEIARVARYLEENADCISISREPVIDENMGNFVHVAILNNDEPAVIMPYGDLPHSPTVRVFNLSRLVVKIDSFIDEVAYENSAALILTNGLSRNLAKRLVYHLTTVRNREYNRFECDEKISVMIGMNDVFRVLNNANEKTPGAQKREEDLLFNSMLYGEGHSIDVAVDEDDHNDLDYESGVRIWTAKNSSIGGYGLHWRAKESANARVGELVGLRNMTREDNPWMVGVVKWMDYAPKSGLFCGIELLSVKVMMLSVLAVLNRELAHPISEEGFMLPSVEGIREEPVLILPAYVFRPGDQLKVNFAERNEHIVLTNLDECLGAFAYFHFKVEEQSDVIKDDDDFGNLWDVL